MKLIIGLGNIGDKYLDTRHNAGFLFVDYLQQEKNLPDFKNQNKFFSQISKSNQLIVAKPTTLMNLSGKTASSLVKFFEIKLEDLIVAHDDLDIKVGEFKLQFGVGPKIHNGLKSIYESLGSDQFWHLRIGVDGRNGLRNMSGADYVLQKMPGLDKKKVETNFGQMITRIEQQLGSLHE